MKTPVLSRIRQSDTHRLIPSKSGESEDSVLARIADSDDHLRGIMELDAATDERRAAEAGRSLGIGVDELVFNIPHAGVINAAFTYAHPLGSRFNGPGRGAWYAGAELATSQAEVAWHKWIELVEVDWLEESVTYDDYLADFAGEFHDIRGDLAFEDCLDPDSYVESQSLGETLLQQGSSGIVYPSVRRKGGVCIACFRPALVDNVRKSARYRFTWTGSPTPVVRLEQSYP